MKRYFSLVMVALTFVLLAACGSTGISDIRYGDEINNQTLRICIDSETSGVHFSDEDGELRRVIFDDLAQDIKRACNVDQVAFEVLPGEGSKRKIALQRLRTEIMAGGGPDVFILNTISGLPDLEHESALLNFPEKNMQAGLFLPLDDYMANNTHFTDWNKQTKVVMDAGRNDEGQIVIPLTYTFSVLVYPENMANITYTTDLTMQEIIESPETAELGASLYTSLGRSDDLNERVIRVHSLAEILGKLADYKSGELLFTEEELYDLLSTMFTLHDDVEKNQLQYIDVEVGNNLLRELSNARFANEMTLVPLYSRKGGVTATIISYAAVNRNSHLPEKAFSVIDYIMQEKMQCESELYSSLLSTKSIPMQHDLGQEGKEMFAALSSGKFLEQPYFEDLLKIKNQITAVNYKSEIDLILEQLVYDSVTSGSVSREDVCEAYEKMSRMVGE